MNEHEPRARVVKFLESISRPDQPVSAIADSADLVEAGLVDSFAILEIVSFLEAEFDVDFADGGINPTEVSSLGGILDLIEKKRP